MKIWILPFSLFLFLCGCSSGSEKLKVAFDPEWTTLSLGADEPYVNGFVEELFLEIGRQGKLKFVRVATNREDLLAGLKEGRYALALTAMPQRVYNLAKYDFSPSVLDLGVVLCAQKGSSSRSLSDFHGKIVGWVEGDEASWLLLQPHPEVFVKSYPSLPELLEAIASGEIEAGLHARLPVINYVEDLYAESLSIVSDPLTPEGLCFIAPKGDAKWLPLFTEQVQKLKKKKKLVALQEKWQLR